MASNRPRHDPPRCWGPLHVVYMNDLETDGKRRMRRVGVRCQACGEFIADDERSLPGLIAVLDRTGAEVGTYSRSEPFQHLVDIGRFASVDEAVAAFEDWFRRIGQD